MITAEFLYVGIRLACRRQVSSIAIELLRESCIHNIQLDIEAINGIMQLLTKEQRFDEAFEIFKSILNGDFGTYVIADVATFGIMVESTDRASNLSYTQNLLQLIFFNGIKYDIESRIYLKALNILALQGEFSYTLRLYQMYEKVVDEIDPKAVCFLIIAYLNLVKGIGKETKVVTTESSHDTQQDQLQPQSQHTSYLNHSIHTMNAMNLATEILAVDKIIQVAKDNLMDINPAVGNLILQYHCRRNNAATVEIYFNRMIKLNIKISITALLEVCLVFMKPGNSERAYSLFSYMRTDNLSPFPQLVRNILDRYNKPTVAKHRLKLINTYFIFMCFDSKQSPITILHIFTYIFVLIKLILSY